MYEYAKFHDKNFDLIQQLEENMTKHGHPGGLLKDSHSNLSQDLQEIEGFNIV